MSEDAAIDAQAGASADLGAQAGASADLDALSTHELHDRAVSRAERHMDVKFFWTLLEAIPAAEALSGKMGEADFDIVSARGQIKDALHSGDGALAEALRPLFLDYLRAHPDA